MRVNRTLTVFPPVKNPTSICELQVNIISTEAETGKADKDFDVCLPDQLSAYKLIFSSPFVLFHFRNFDKLAKENIAENNHLASSLVHILL